MPTPMQPSLGNNERFRVTGNSRENPALVLHFKTPIGSNLDQAKFVSNWDISKTTVTGVQAFASLQGTGITTTNVVIRGHVKLIKPSATTTGVIRVVMWLDKNGKPPSFGGNLSGPLLDPDPDGATRFDLTTGTLTIVLTNDSGYNEPADLFDQFPTLTPPSEAVPTDSAMNLTTIALAPISVDLTPD